MEAHTLASLADGTLELDLCFSCHGIWFDPQENLKLSPAAVVELFRLLHAHRDAARQPLALKMDCRHCRSAFSLLDPKAVEQALQGYAKAASSAGAIKIPELADALVMVERDRLRAEREAKASGGNLLTADAASGVDLWGLGIAMVWSILN